MATADLTLFYGVIPAARLAVATAVAFVGAARQRRRDAFAGRPD